MKGTTVRYVRSQTCNCKNGSDLLKRGVEAQHNILSRKVFHDWSIIKLVGFQIHIPKLYFSRSHILAMPIAYLVLYITLSNFSKNYI